MSRLILLSFCGVLALVAAGPTAPPALSATPDKPDPAAAERARKTVRMLDDIYKTAIVLITDKYVKDKRDYPAGRAAIRWFADISKKGSHRVRLIDATGEPYGAANVAEDDFDKEGVKQLKAGKDYYEQLIQEGATLAQRKTPLRRDPSVAAPRGTRRWGPSQRAEHVALAGQKATIPECRAQHEKHPPGALRPLSEIAVFRVALPDQQRASAGGRGSRETTRPGVIDSRG
jgi:hypothetical protein